MIKKRLRIPSGKQKVDVAKAALNRANTIDYPDMDTLDNYRSIKNEVEKECSVIKGKMIVCYVFGVQDIAANPSLIREITCSYMRGQVFPLVSSPRIVIPSTWAEDLRELAKNDDRYSESIISNVIDVIQFNRHKYIVKVDPKRESGVVPYSFAKDTITIALQCKLDFPNARVLVPSDDVLLRAECKENGLLSLSSSEMKSRLERVRFYREVWRDPDVAFSNRLIDWGTLLSEDDYSSMSLPTTWDQFFNCCYWDEIKQYLSDFGESMPEQFVAKTEADREESLAEEVIALSNMEYVKNTADYFNYSMCSEMYTDGNKERSLELAEMQYDFLSKQGAINSDGATHDTLIFRLTGLHSSNKDVGFFKEIQMKKDADFVYFWARQVNRSGNRDNLQLANHVYEKTHRFFSWKDKPESFSRSYAAKFGTAQTSKLSPELKKAICDVCGNFWE